MITYTTGQVARAVGAPARRIEGWAEQGLVAPRTLRGRTRHGDRRQYGFGDVMTVAVLAELQRLLGSAFRPGGIAPLVARELRGDPHGLVASAGDHERPAVLVLRAERGKARVEVVYHAALHQVAYPTALVVNLTFLAQRVRRVLDA